MGTMGVCIRLVCVERSDGKRQSIWNDIYGLIFPTFTRETIIFKELVFLGKIFAKKRPCVRHKNTQEINMGWSLPFSIRTYIELGLQSSCKVHLLVPFAHTDHCYIHDTTLPHK